MSAPVERASKDWMDDEEELTFKVPDPKPPKTPYKHLISDVESSVYDKEEFTYRRVTRSQLQKMS